MFALGSTVVFSVVQMHVFPSFFEHSKPWGISVEQQWETSAPLAAPASPPLLISLSPPLLFRLNIQLTVRERRQGALHYTLLCLPTSLASKHSADSVCCFVKFTTVGCLHVNDLEFYFLFYFFKECILKRNLYFCLCLLSRAPFLSHLLLPPAACCRLHNWCKYRRMCQ